MLFSSEEVEPTNSPCQSVLGEPTQSQIASESLCKWWLFLISKWDLVEDTGWLLGTVVLCFMPQFGAKAENKKGSYSFLQSLLFLKKKTFLFISVKSQTLVGTFADSTKAGCKWMWKPASIGLVWNLKHSLTFLFSACFFLAAAECDWQRMWKQSRVWGDQDWNCVFCTLGRL